MHPDAGSQHNHADLHDHEQGCGHDHDHQHGCGSCGSCGCHGSGDEGDAVYVFTREQIRALDQRAVSQYGIPSILLMENAARGVTGAILDGIDGHPDAGVLILAGPGNNGGDGLAAARHLHNAGVRVAVLLAPADADLSSDTAANLKIVRAMGLPLVQQPSDAGAAFDAALARLGKADVIVDALLGTGVNRAVTGGLATLISRVGKARAGGAMVLSVDLPSGMDADTGKPAAGPGEAPGACVTADLTVTLAGLKEGFLAEGARAYIGDLLVVDIGAPIELVRELGEAMQA